MEAITFSSFDSYQKWEEKPWKNRGDEYKNYKEHLSERIIATIYKHNPHLKDKIAFHELSTPLSTKAMAHYEFGELYGVSDGGGVQFNFNQQIL